MQEQFEKNKIEALREIEATTSQEALFEVQVKYLGRKGLITELMHQLATLSKEEKPAMGKLSNEVKRALEAAFEAKKQNLAQEKISRQLSDAWVDPTITLGPYLKKYLKNTEVGHLHPLSQVQQDVERIFSEMGFTILDGPEVESEYYNFEGLNIPSWHPARDMQDTFFVQGPRDEKQGRLVLRTHTSPVQVRGMESFGAPLRIIVPGRVFRNEATDARHEHTFNQVEGMLIDKDISLAHLKGVMQEFLTRLFGREMKVRFRPGYFPFVEPGIELDMSCLLCNETGCRVCKHTGWLEFMGCGMTHPNVLKAGGIDPKKYQGWAFGFGLTRLAMMKYGIDDIRLLLSGDLRFLEQF